MLEYKWRNNFSLHFDIIPLEITSKYHLNEDKASGRYGEREWIVSNVNI